MCLCVCFLNCVLVDDFIILLFYVFFFYRSLVFVSVLILYYLHSFMPIIIIINPVQWSPNYSCHSSMNSGKFRRQNNKIRDSWICRTGHWRTRSQGGNCRTWQWMTGQRRTENDGHNINGRKMKDGKWWTENEGLDNTDRTLTDWTMTYGKRTEWQWKTGHWDIETHIFKHSVTKSVNPRRWWRRV